MINKRLMKPAVMIIVAMLSVSACGKQAEPVSAEPIETVSEEESTEESLEPMPSPTVAPTAEPVEENSDSEENLENSENEVDTAEELEEELGYIVIDINDKILYATQTCNLRQGPSTEYDKVGTLSYSQEITVNGKVETDDGKLWWVLKTDDESIQMVSGGLVSETKPTTGNNTTGSTGSTGSTAQPSTNEDDDYTSDQEWSDWAESVGLPEVGAGQNDIDYGNGGVIVY